MVAAADWLAGGDQVVTASWDYTAIVFDTESASIVDTLTGRFVELDGLTLPDL